MANKRYSHGCENPWLDSYEVAITSDRRTSHTSGDYITFKLAFEAARELVDMLECWSEPGLVVTIGQTV